VEIVDVGDVARAQGGGESIQYSTILWLTCFSVFDPVWWFRGLGVRFTAQNKRVAGRELLHEKREPARDARNHNTIGVYHGLVNRVCQRHIPAISPTTDNMCSRTSSSLAKLGSEVRTSRDLRRQLGHEIKEVAEPLSDLASALRLSKKLQVASAFVWYNKHQNECFFVVHMRHLTTLRSRAPPLATKCKPTRYRRVH
jgi:hypothetical protein